ncbi:hypothetical protein BGZ65_008981 [Modicella reniformis]|uniref:Uncharacterized protein n=1 Tax=Modicella reniformis TaxID=1440133 RepID=A0A9P6M801_9FUNG|nr:hypothetical protein BGZ65_008981 [Modicella reniformis]
MPADEEALGSRAITNEQREKEDEEKEQQQQQQQQQRQQGQDEEGEEDEVMSEGVVHACTRCTVPSEQDPVLKQLFTDDADASTHINICDWTFSARLSNHTD